MTNNEFVENEDFREKVGEWVDVLKDLTDKDDIVGLLQDINYLILDYKIVVDNDFVIYPIWVEAYYRNEKKGFIDESCHNDDNPPRQFKLREHKNNTNNERRGGVDLYLSDSKEYYLSFLIKLALIKESNGDLKLCSQSKIKNKLKNHPEVKNHFKTLDTLKLTFTETDLNTSELRKAKCKRVGLSNNNDDNNNDNNNDDVVNYNEMKLAACYDEEKPRNYNVLKRKTGLYVLKKD